MIQTQIQQQTGLTPVELELTDSFVKALGKLTKLGHFPRSVHGEHLDDGGSRGNGTPVLRDLRTHAEFHGSAMLEDIVFNTLALNFPKRCLEAGRKLSEEEREVLLTGLTNIEQYFRDELCLFAFARWISRFWIPPLKGEEPDYTPNPLNVVSAETAAIIASNKEFAKLSGEWLKYLKNTDDSNRSIKRALLQLTLRARARRADGSLFLGDEIINIDDIPHVLGAKRSTGESLYNLVVARVSDLDEDGKTGIVDPATYDRATGSFKIGTSTLIRSAFGSQVVFEL